MKKKLSMTLMVLVAFIAFAMQSCKSDNNDNSMAYKFSWRINIQEKGDLTDEQKAELENSFVGSETSEYQSDEMAEYGNEVVAKQIASRAKLVMGNNMTVKFTMTIITTRVFDNHQISMWDVIYDKGVVTLYKY